MAVWPLIHKFKRKWEDMCLKLKITCEYPMSLKFQLHSYKKNWWVGYALLIFVIVVRITYEELSITSFQPFWHFYHKSKIFLKLCLKNNSINVWWKC